MGLREGPELLDALPWVVQCLFILRSRLLLYSAGSGVNRVQVALSGFSMRLFCFVQAKALSSLCRYCCIYFLAALVLVCVDVMVMSSGALGGGMSAV